MNNSTKINHNPRLTKNAPNSTGDFLWPCKKIDVPDNKTNTGAQKWVIHLVKNKAGLVVAKSKGSWVLAVM